MMIPRIIKNRPMFCLAVISVVSLGIGVSTAASSVINALLFKPIPTIDYGSIYRIDAGTEYGALTPVDARDLMDVLEQDFSVFSYVHERNMECSYQSEKFLADTCQLQGDPMETLKWTPIRGRVLTKEDMKPGAPPALMVSYEFWKTRLGATPDAVGSLIEINEDTFEIVGILEPQYDRLNRMRSADLFYSYYYTSEDWKYDNRGWEDQHMVIRIPTNEKMVEVEEKLARTSAELRAKYKYSATYLMPRVISENDAVAKSYSKLYEKGKVITFLVAALLLIASLNVGNMLLANVYRRQHEFAIRRALGASSNGLLKIIFGESFLMTGAGGILGVFVAYILIHLAQHLDFGADLELKMDAIILRNALILTLLVGFLSALIPSFQIVYGSFNISLREGTRTSNVSIPAKVLLVFQVAFSATLLVCGLMFYVSLNASLSLWPGYETEHLLGFRFYMQNVPSDHKKTVADEVVRKIQEIPGVDEVGIGMSGPFRGAGGTQISTGDMTPQAYPELTRTGYFFALPGYFKAMGVPIIRGRDLEESDIQYPHISAVINESMVERFWPKQEALDQYFYPWGNIGEDPVRVVGICRNYMMRSWDTDTPVFYLPEYLSQCTVHVRWKGDENHVREQINRLIRDSGNPYIAGELMDFSVFQIEAFRDTRSTLYVIGFMAITSMGLSFFGTYYITRNYVRNCRKDMSIRLSLGAKPSYLLWFAMGRCMGIVSFGLVIGLVLSRFTTLQIQDSVSGVEGYGLLLTIVAFGGMALVAALASYLPSRELLRIHPSEVLREL